MPQAESRLALTPRRIDVVAAGVLFVIAFVIASWYVPFFSASGGKPKFYQEEFGAAVMTACGFGFVNPDGLQSPALNAFLSRERDSISCSELAAPAPAPLRPMQRAFRYLMLTVGNTWWVRGQVSWSALTPLFALLYGVTVVLAFGIFRQGMGPVLSAAGAFLIAVSTLHLNNLPHLRDYAKAPFVLALVLIAMRLVRPPFTPRRTLLLAAIAGVATGVGMGFRNDVMVAIPAFVVLLALFLPIGWREYLGVRAAAIAVYLLTLGVAMFPMLGIYNTGGGSSSQHLVLLGLTPAFSHDLGVDNSHLYEVGFEYRDELALAMIDNYADRRLNQHAFLQMYGGDYDRAATGLLRDIATDFPADLITRVYASAIRITELPYLETTSALMPPPFVEGRARALFGAREWLVRKLSIVWPWAFVITLGALSLAGLHLGVFAGLFVFYLSGYPALQFQERHFFHLEFVAWWALLFALSLIGRLAIGRLSFPADWRQTAPRAVAVWVVAAVLVAVPLSTARRYQREHVQERLYAILAAPRADVVPVPKPLAGGVIFETPDLPQSLPQDDGVHAAYLAADLGGAKCDRLSVDVTLRYAALNPNYDFTHVKTIRMPRVNEPVQIFFPAYFRSPGSSDRSKEPFSFRGIEMADGAAACLMKVSRVEQPEAIPELLDLRLPPRWPEATPYATISGIEGRDNPPETYAFPADLPRLEFQQRLAAPAAPFTINDIKNVSRTLALTATGFKVDGVGGVGGRGPLLYLVEMKDRPLKKHTAFVAEGRIDRGGVTFGLVRGVEWIVQLHIRQQGPFSVVIDVPEDGEYRVIMANNLTGMSLDNRVIVTRAGLVAPDGGADR